jgi:beta-lactam-binding protein with PASTA domain
MAKSKGFKDLLIHIGIICTVFFLLAYGFFYLYLPSVTHHGESIEVPDLSKKSIAEIEILINEKNLRYKVYDSTYTPNFKPLTVINQYPKAGEKVKSNRTIYIALSSMNPPGVKMPKLIGNSLKAAEMNLKSRGLILGNVRFVPNANVGAVIDQLISGKRIEAEFSISKGTVIDLIVGSGLGNLLVQIPCLEDLDLIEAKKLLSAQGLEVGVVSYDENSGKPKGMVTRQKPECTPGDTTNKVKNGEIIDLWIAGENLDENDL